MNTGKMASKDDKAFKYRQEISQVSEDTVDLFLLISSCFALLEESLAHGS